MKYQLATNQDMPAIEAALADLLAKSPAPQMKYADLMEAILSVRHAIHEERAVIVGDFFLMFNVGRIWYSTQPFLMEDIVLRIGRTVGNSKEDAIDAIIDLAEVLGCVPVVGDAQTGIMAAAYKARGFVPVGVQLMKG